MSDHPGSGQYNPLGFDQNKTEQMNFMYFGNYAAPKNQFAQYQPTDSRFYTIKEDEIDSSESIAKDTGLLWIYDAVSPADNKVESFSTQAQMSMQNDDKSEALENKMENFGLSDSNICLSSNSLQGYNWDSINNMNVPRYHIQSSQSVNTATNFQHYFQPWEVPKVNVHAESSELSTTISSFTSIASVPPVIAKTIVFDFEINDEFKLSQVRSNYFIDSDSAEIVYFWPLAEQVVTYNYNWYFKWKLGSANRGKELSHDFISKSSEFYSNQSNQINSFSHNVDSNLNTLTVPFLAPQEYTRNESYNFKAPRQTLSSLGTQYSTLEGKDSLVNILT